MESLRYLYRIGRGPSSSHTMGPAKCAEYILNKFPEANKFEVVLFGSLALTGKGHLTDEVLLEVLGKERTKISFDISSDIPHPNTLKIAAYQDENLLGDISFISLGGGAIKIIGENDDICTDIYNFRDFSEIKNYCINNNLSLPEFVYHFEGEDIKSYLEEVYEAMYNAIERGLNKEGILPGGLNVKRKAKILYSKIEEEIESERHLVEVSSYAFALSEENASGGTIVTAPTCGSCGVLGPAIIYFIKSHDNLNKKDAIDALAVASIFGNVIKQNASIAGAFAGCQSEIGSACSMAAAALAYLQGLNINAIEYAAEIAMEHHLGLTCDPVKGLVQIPCIERNAVASLRAFESVSLAKILYESSQVSFDTVVKTMYETGKDLNPQYRETSLGGLAKFFDKTNC